MLTLEKIKELSTYTESIKVLQAACNLNNSDIQYVIRIYTMLKAGDLNISQEFADIITENYITQRLINSKIPIEKLVESEEFRKKIQTLTKEELLRYMALCDNESSNDLLYNKNVIEGYSAKDHLAIMDMADNVRTKSTEVKDIFFASISNQCPSDTIRIIIKSLDNRLTDTNKGEIVRLLTNEAFYELYPSVDMIDIISVILSMQDARVIGVLVDIAIAGAWMNGKYGLDFKDVAMLVPYTSDTNKLLLEKESTYQLEYEDIIEMLDITKDASHLITLFTNDFAREHLTHEQMISLVQEFDLGDIENFDSYATALSIAIKMGIKDSLYQDLRNSLAKDIYETTVGEYLATCNSITEFVRTLERECGENVSVDPNAFLNLKLK